MTRTVPVLVALLLALLLAPAAQAAEVPPGATWSEEYFESGDGTRLHADVLRPKGLPETTRTPVILTVSPYLNRSGATTPDDPFGEGPSNRFYDFLEQAKLFERGYSYVMVDLRGFGGSAGCNDWGGPGEQMDVKAAVEWVGSQPWSTGKVGLYGKSYDAWTGLMGIAQRPEHLAAVVSQEPVVDGYRYLYMNRVRFPNSLLTPALFQAIDANPGSANAGSDYVLNGATATDPACYAENLAQQSASNDPETPYWRARNLLPTTAGARTPTFLTQGFLEDNTKPDHVFTLFNGLAGPRRAWFGQWDHVRGNDVDGDGRPLTGREGFIDETMRFYDRYVKGLSRSQAPTHKDPPVVLQQGDDGRFRSESRWPPADTVARPFELKPGEYEDDTTGNNGDATSGGTTSRGSWSFTPPLPHGAILSGTPQLEVKLTAQESDANLVANVYDVGPDNRAMLLSRGAYLVPESGSYRFELYGQDWVLPAGHRLGVLLSGANDEWWTHVPTNSTVTVESGRIELPFLTFARDRFISGGPAAKLQAYKEGAPFEVDSATVAERETPFQPPPPLKPRR